MTKVDQFESVFRGAAKTVYEHRALKLETVLVLTDLAPAEAEAWSARVRAFLRVLDERAPGLQWKVVPGAAFTTVRDLLDLVEAEVPDLVVTYRSLHSEAWPWTYTLGRHVDVLAQECPMPVLLLPNPHAEAQAPESFSGGKPDYERAGTRSVMALTDHLPGDHRLVSWAAHLTARGGTLTLAHVEDGRAFDRFLAAIEKIPQIDTETARETIRERLLKDPRDYIRSCAEGLGKAGLDLTVGEHVVLGHHLAEVRRMITEHAVGLLVLDTKDDDQLAMHGLAYPLVVELRHVPILML